MLVRVKVYNIEEHNNSTRKQKKQIAKYLLLETSSVFKLDLKLSLEPSYFEKRKKFTFFMKSALSHVLNCAGEKRIL